MFDSNTLFFPMDPLSRELSRVRFQGRLYTAQAILCVPGKSLDASEALSRLHSLGVVIKLVPFDESLRAKMLAEVAQKEGVQKSRVFGVSASLQITEETAKISIQKLVDVRSLEATLDGSGEALLENAQGEVCQLTEREEQDFKATLEQMIQSAYSTQILEPFAGFVPSLKLNSWKERLDPKFKGLMPWAQLFPRSLPMEREKEGQLYILDDMYCTNPSCDCFDATCVILRINPQTGEEKPWGGFRLNLQTGKIRPMEQFKAKFNPQEWLKSMDSLSPFDVKNLLQSRYDYIRKHVVPALSEIKKT